MRFPSLSSARRGALALTVLAAWSGCKTTGAEKPGASLQATPAAAKSARIEVDQAGLVAALVRKHGEPSRARAERDLEEMVSRAPRWSRKQWAHARLTRRFAVRPSGAALQAVAKATADAEAYIAGYNLWMHHVLAPDGRRLFPKGVRLLTHWNLRDQIKVDYAEPDKALALT